MAITAPNQLVGGLARPLVMHGLISEAQATEALAAAHKAEIPLVSYLVQEGITDADVLARVIAEAFSTPLIDLDSIQIDQEVAAEVGEQWINKHRLIPFFKRGKHIYAAVSDPSNLQGFNEIRFHTGHMIEPVLCEENKLVRHLERIAQMLDNNLVTLDNTELGELQEAGIEAEEDQDPFSAAGLDAEDAPVVRYVRDIMLNAIRRGASDIHFEPYEQFYRVRLRIDGILNEINRPPPGFSSKLAARLKVLARLDIAERRLPQDGRINLRLSKRHVIDFRVSTIPTTWGEKIVLRLLDPASTQLGIEALGFTPSQMELFTQALARPHGMILVTGPTGSGKTVTLYTAVQALNTQERNISTAEDPVEIQLPGINQVNVNPHIGLTFASALRAFLRQDPDVILVGEIRDLETAEIAVKAAQTGHLVLSTLHTNDAPKALTRLRDIGLPTYSIASSVNLILAQRLVRTLCKNCRKLQDIPREILQKEGFSKADLDEGIRVYGPVGCPQCNQGYRGRTGIFEVMPVTEEMERSIISGADDAKIQSIARSAGIWDMHRSGLEKIKAGITSLDEIHRVTIE